MWWRAPWGSLGMGYMVRGVESCRWVEQGWDIGHAPWTQESQTSPAAATAWVWAAPYVPLRGCLLQPGCLQHPDKASTVHCRGGDRSKTLENCLR